MEIAAINIHPGGKAGQSSERIVFLFQNGKRLEEYVEEFLDTCHHTTCSGLALMEGFWVGLDKVVVCNATSKSRLVIVKLHLILLCGLHNRFSSSHP